jgi:hypothetical protein
MKALILKIFPFPEPGFNTSWKQALAHSPFRVKFLLSLGLLLLLAACIPSFFSFIQGRTGYAVYDPVLEFIRARNVSFSIFILIYTAIALTFINLISRPDKLMTCLQAFFFLMSMRIIILFCIPLEPSGTMIPLEDPLIGRFFYSGQAITRDLFFSGHVSTLFLLLLINPVVYSRWFIGIATVLVGLFLVMQHVHYTYDVLAAPIFAWISYKLASKGLFAAENPAVGKGE